MLSCCGSEDSETQGNKEQKQCTCLRQGIPIIIKKSKEEATKECSVGVSPGKITKCE